MTITGPPDDYTDKLKAAMVGVFGADPRPKRFLEFVNIKTGEVGQRVDVTGQSERNAERCLRGMLINMHQDWFVRDTKDGP